MKHRVLAGTLAIGLTLVACSKQNTTRVTTSSESGIIGGSDVEAGDETSLITAALYDTFNQSICTVSIIDREWVLTAAHCVENTAPKALAVIFERNLLDAPAGPTQQPVMRRVAEVFIHPQYTVTNQRFEQLAKDAEANGKDLSLEEIDEVTDWGDIALIRLSSPIPSTHKIVNMLPAHLSLSADQSIILAGYGVSDGALNTGDGVFRKVETVIAEPVRGESEILIDQRSGKGACRGDSGGPAYVSVDGNLYLVGVTSHGAYDKKNDCSQFAVYSSVQAFSTWISETMAQQPKTSNPVKNIANFPVAAAL